MADTFGTADARCRLSLPPQGWRPDPGLRHESPSPGGQCHHHGPILGNIKPASHRLLLQLLCMALASALVLQQLKPTESRVGKKGRIRNPTLSQAPFKHRGGRIPAPSRDHDKAIVSLTQLVFNKSFCKEISNVRFLFESQTQPDPTPTIIPNSSAWTDLKMPQP